MLFADGFKWGKTMVSVLVIDDEDFILEVLQCSLVQNGFSVKTASGGREGIEKFERGDFDLVITDIRMPDVDGNSVGRHIRRSKRGRIPIIGISGTPWATKDTVFDKILSKPFKLDTLANTVQRLVASRNIQQHAC